MQSVRQFDDDHADILCHGDEDLAEVFRLLFLFRCEFDLFKFGHALHELQNLVAEFRLDIPFGNGGIFYDVVQKRRGNGGGVQSQIDQDFGNVTRVSEIFLTRRALLVGVRFLCEFVRLFAQRKIGAAVRFPDFFQNLNHQPKSFPRVYIPKSCSNRFFCPSA